jgi:hypothetical protein
MQNDPTSIWKERGITYQRFRDLKGCNGQPPQWRVLHFALRQLTLKLGRSLTTFGSFMSQTLNLGRYAASRNHLSRASLGHIGDVHVGYQVEINVETAQTEPGNV